MAPTEINAPTPARTFTEAAINKTILRLAGPAVLENLLSMAVFMADTLIVGRLNDASALAAVGISNSFINIAQQLFMALGVGALALVARAWGEGDVSKAQRFGAQSITLGVVMALLTMAVLMPLAEPFLRYVMRVQDEAVIVQGRAYSQIILATSFLALPAMTMNNIMRATGDTRTPMLITLVVNIVNIGLALVLVYGAGPIPAMRVQGAAIATAIARGLGGVLALVALSRRSARVQITLRSLWAWVWGDVLRIWRLAWPNMVEQAIQRVGFIIFVGMVASLGTAALAAHEIADAVESMAFMPAWGFAIAAASLVGQALGARQPRIAELVVKRTAVLSSAVMLVVVGVFVLFSRPLAGLFSGQPEVVDLAATAVLISALELHGLALYMLFGNVLRGAGDTRSPMIVSLIGVVFFRISAVWILVNGLGLGLAGVWLGTAIDWAGRASVMVVLYRTGRWKTARV